MCRKMQMETLTLNAQLRTRAHPLVTQLSTLGHPDG